jgi:hypothetical protein
MNSSTILTTWKSIKGSLCLGELLELLDADAYGDM